MNNKFSFKRFGQVIAMDFNHYFHRFGISMIVWVCLPIAIWILGLVFSNITNIAQRSMLISICVIGTTMTVPARVYGKANHATDGVSFATLPATQLEKFLSMSLYCSVVTPLVCFIGCMAIDSFLTLLPFGDFYGFIDVRGGFYSYFFVICLILLVSSLFLFGNMLFKIRKTSKTFAWLLLIFFLIMLIISTLEIHYHFLQRMLEYELLYYPVPVLTLYWITCAFILGIAVLFYYLTYRKIRNQKY